MIQIMILYHSRTDVYKYSFFSRTIHDWNSLDIVSISLFHNLQLTFPAANALHTTGNGLSSQLGIYRSTVIPPMLLI